MILKPDSPPGANVCITCPAGTFTGAFQLKSNKTTMSNTFDIYLYCSLPNQNDLIVIMIYCFSILIAQEGECRSGYMGPIFSIIYPYLE
jgi:hypothetical protein